MYFTPLPSVDTILAHFDFDQDTGVLRWRGDTEETKYLNHRYVGEVAGSPNKGGYRRVKFAGRNFLVSRLVFKLAHGRDPVGQVDHENLDTSDDRPDNLREASAAQNTWNKGNKKRVFDLPKGVCFHRRSGKYRARIQARGHRVELGDFGTPEAAAKAYAAASAKYHGGFGRIA